MLIFAACQLFLRLFYRNIMDENQFKSDCDEILVDLRAKSKKAAISAFFANLPAIVWPKFIIIQSRKTGAEW